jgi:hypothetical protein
LRLPSLEYFHESGNVLIYTAPILGVVVLVALLVFFWQRSGPGSGRTFGNRIATHIGIPRSLFHSILAHGVKGSARERLASLEKAQLSLDQASIALGPSLSRGIERLEAHFGTQAMVDKVKPIVAKLMSQSEHTP